MNNDDDDNDNDNDDSDDDGIDDDDDDDDDDKGVFHHETDNKIWILISTLVQAYRVLCP